MIFALLVAAAHGGSPDAWIAVGEAQVLEATGESEAAALIYQQLSRQLSGDDPARAEALYRLGRLMIRLGDVDAAIRAFDDCVRIRAWRARCLTERTDVEIDRSAVRSLPTRWTFDDTAHGLVHPWSDESGSIRIAVPIGEGDPVLTWTDNPKRGETDTLIVGFDLDGQEPERVRFEARATAAGTVLRIQADDIDGRRYSGPPLPVSAVPRQIEIRLEELVAEDGAGTLDPRLLYRLHLVDERALSLAGGEATLTLDTFEVY